MNYHPFPLYVPMGGEVGGRQLKTEELVRNARLSTLCEMAERLNGYVNRFNESKNNEARKKELEQLGFWRGVIFPEIGQVLHSNRPYGSLRKKIPKPIMFIVSSSDIIIQRLKNSTDSEYEEIKRFPLDAVILNLKVVEVKDDNDFEISVLWKTGSEENASFDSSQL